MKEELSRQIKEQYRVNEQDFATLDKHLEYCLRVNSTKKRDIYAKQECSALDFVNNCKLESDPEKQMRTVSGRRTMNRLTAGLLIQGGYDFQALPRYLEQPEVYVRYLVDFKADSLEEFFRDHESKEIYDFLLRHFGTDISSTNGQIKPHETLELEWKNLNHQIKMKEVVEYMTNLYTLQTKHFKHSKVVTVQISNRQDLTNIKNYLTIKEKLIVVSHEFNCTPFYVENSFEKSGVIRAYFLFDNYLPDKYKTKVEQFFKSQYKFNIKIQKTDDYFILPFSKAILLSGEYSENSTFGIQQETLNQTFDRVTKYFKENKNSNSLRGIECLVGKIRYGDDLEVITVDDPSETLSLFDSSSLNVEKFSYGCGTRFKNQVSLAVYCCGKGLSFQEYLNLAYSLNDGSSKDMENWSSIKIERELRKYYEFASRVATPTRTITHERTWSLEDDGTKTYRIKDNQAVVDLDSSDTKDRFVDIIKYFYDIMFNKKKQKGAWRSYFIKDSIILYKFLERKRSYDLSTGKMYKDEKFKSLNDGVVIPISMYKDIKKYLNLKTSLSKLIKFLSDIHLLEVITIDGYEYSRKNQLFARHFRLSGREAIYRMYLRVINIIKRIKINKLYKNKSKSSLFSDIYYVNYFTSQRRNQTELMRLIYSKMKQIE